MIDGTHGDRVGAARGVRAGGAHAWRLLCWSSTKRQRRTATSTTLSHCSNVRVTTVRYLKGDAFRWQNLLSETNNLHSLDIKSASAQIGIHFSDNLQIAWQLPTIFSVQIFCEYCEHVYFQKKTTGVTYMAGRWRWGSPKAGSGFLDILLKNQ